MGCLHCRALGLKDRGGGSGEDGMVLSLTFGAGQCEACEGVGSLRRRLCRCQWYCCLRYDFNSAMVMHKKGLKSVLFYASDAAI